MPRTPRASYRTLHRIADGQIGPVEDAFLTAIGTSRNEVDLDALTDALARGDVDAAFAALHPTRFARALRASLVAILARTARSAATASAVHLPARIVRADLRFNVINEAAVQAAATRTAFLVRQVTDDTRANIRAVIARAQREGIAFQGQKRLVREVLVPDVLAVHGLTTRQWQAVENVAVRLVIEDISESAVARRKARYATQLLNQRAATIARTETIRASALGQQALWEEARAQGYLIGNERRIWIVTPDDRLCPYCRAIPQLNPDGVLLTEPFRAPGADSVQYPPAHPQCRCAVALQFLSLTERRAA